MALKTFKVHTYLTKHRGLQCKFQRQRFFMFVGKRGWRDFAVIVCCHSRSSYTQHLLHYFSINFNLLLAISSSTTYLESYDCWIDKFYKLIDDKCTVWLKKNRLVCFRTGLIKFFIVLYDLRALNGELKIQLSKWILVYCFHAWKQEFTLFLNSYCSFTKWEW